MRYFFYFQIYIEGTIGSSYLSDFAIDDTQLTEFGCQSNSPLFYRVFNSNYEYNDGYSYVAVKTKINKKLNFYATKEVYFFVNFKL